MSYPEGGLARCYTPASSCVDGTGDRPPRRSSPKVVNSGKSGEVASRVPSSSSRIPGICKHQSSPRSFLILASQSPSQVLAAAVHRQLGWCRSPNRTVRCPLPLLMSIEKCRPCLLSQRKRQLIRAFTFAYHAQHLCCCQHFCCTLQVDILGRFVRQLVWATSGVAKLAIRRSATLLGSPRLPSPSPGPGLRRAGPAWASRTPRGHWRRGRPRLPGWLFRRPGWRGCAP